MAPLQSTSTPSSPQSSPPPSKLPDWGVEPDLRERLEAKVAAGLLTSKAVNRILGCCKGLAILVSKDLTGTLRTPLHCRERYCERCRAEWLERAYDVIERYLTHDLQATTVYIAGIPLGAHDSKDALQAASDRARKEQGHQQHGFILRHLSHAWLMSPYLIADRPQTGKGRPRKLPIPVIDWTPLPVADALAWLKGALTDPDLHDVEGLHRFAGLAINSKPEQPARYTRLTACRKAAARLVQDAVSSALPTAQQIAAGQLDWYAPPTLSPSPAGLADEPEWIDRAEGTCLPDQHTAGRDHAQTAMDYLQHVADRAQTEIANLAARPRQDLYGGLQAAIQDAQQANQQARHVLAAKPALKRQEPWHTDSWEHIGDRGWIAYCDRVRAWLRSDRAQDPIARPLTRARARLWAAERQRLLYRAALDRKRAEVAA